MSLLSKISARINAYRRIPQSVVDLHDEVKRYLPSNPVIVEAGAHMGYDTFGLSKLWPRGTIHAFEPVPNIYSELCDRVKSCKNVRTYNVALGEREGEVPMYVSSGNSSGSSSILKPTKHLEFFPEVSFDETVNVKLTTFSQWAKDAGVKNIDLMWLDMQGYEVNALKGAGDIMRQVRVIYTELCSDELYQGLTTRNEYIAFLQSLGFQLISAPSPDEVINEGLFINTRLTRK
jgi:2-O-methyltransferase